MRRKPPSKRRLALDDDNVGSGAAPRPQRAPAASGVRRPLVVALVPDPDVWRVSGAGRTLVARRRADGRISWASVVFDLKRPAAVTFFGNSETEEGPFEEILDALYRIDDAPPMIGGSATLASRFAHGALAFARSADPSLGTPDPSLFGVFGDPRGPDAQLKKALVGEDGLCPVSLVDHCAHEASAALEDGQALAVHVAMAFKVHSPTELARAVATDNDFSPARGKKGTIDWAPVRASGRKLGTIYLDGESLEAETVSLDLAGLLCARLKRLAQGGIELTQVEHKPLD